MIAKHRKWAKFKIQLSRTAERSNQNSSVRILQNISYHWCYSGDPLLMFLGLRSTSKGLVGSGTNNSALCISICLTGECKSKKHIITAQIKTQRKTGPHIKCITPVPHRKDGITSMSQRSVFDEMKLRRYILTGEIQCGVLPTNIFLMMAEWVKTCSKTFNF
jgi:hypothetical protein